MKIHLQPDAEAATSGTVQRLQERIAELERERDNLLKNREDLLELAMNAATADLRAQLAEARADSEQKSKRITSLLASLVILRGCPICSGHCKHGDGRVEYLCYPHRVIADCFKPETPEEAKTHFAARKSEESDDGG